MTFVLVTRARADAECTAARLRELGYAPLLSPVIDIEAAGAAIPCGPFDAVVATSAKAFEHTAGADLAALSRLPLYVVGARTAQAAAKHGLRATLVAPDAQSLLPALSARFSMPTRFLYLAGGDRKHELERALAKDGHAVTIAEVYAARAAPGLSHEAVAALKNGEIGAILHYSRRSADIFLKLAAAQGLAEKLRAVPHLALSEDVATPLRSAGGARVMVAARPDDEHLLRCLAELPDLRRERSGSPCRTRR
ncbi:MAG: uroporphyrinogen-III synthase [Methylocystis sp.]|nr:uroporphyrinogen-III synthase [Methylocystis sp.]